MGDFMYSEKKSMANGGPNEIAHKKYHPYILREKEGNGQLDYEEK